MSSCAYTAALYDKLLGPQKVSLAAFVATEPVAGHHDFEVCGSPSLITASAAGTNAKPIPMPRIKPDMTALATPAHSGKPKPRVKPVEASAVAPAAPPAPAPTATP